MNAQQKDKEDKISLLTISKKLNEILDEMKVIADEIQEMKDRENDR